MRKTVAEEIGESGVVVYRVDGIGAFTIGWDFTAYPLRADTEGVIVRYGVATGAEATDWTFWARRHQWPEAPTLNGITLLSCQHVTLDDVTDYLADDRPERMPWWVKAERLAPSGHLAVVPDRTRRQIGNILAELIDDYLHRDDAEALLEAHYRHHATTRALEHQHNLALARNELTEWERRATHETRRLQAQLALYAETPFAPPSVFTCVPDASSGTTVPAAEQDLSANRLGSIHTRHAA